MIEKQEELRYEFTLSSRESFIIDQCLRYCLHRLRTNPQAGIRNVMKAEEVEMLIEELK